MCYFLYVASPLTLSEVRSMLPAGLSADLASSTDQQALRLTHPAAVTVARLLVGHCSCDLVRTRLPDPKQDERHLRERYRRLTIPRPAIIAALERHRRRGWAGPAQADWPVELSRFVAEHARNAGPTIYYLAFSPDTPSLSVTASIRQITSSTVTATSDRWLHEEIPTLVLR